MNTGKLRSRVVLQKPVDVKNPDGSVTQGRQTYASNVSAEVKSLSVTQLINARQLFSDVSSKVRIRYRTGVSPNDWVLSGKRILGVKGILDPDNKNIYLDLMCEELSSGT